MGIKRDDIKEKENIMRKGEVKLHERERKEKRKKGKI